jgi:hypothetical protein
MAEETFWAGGSRRDVNFWDSSSAEPTLTVSLFAEQASGFA